jgi:uncharacterized membrane protein
MCIGLAAYVFEGTDTAEEALRKVRAAEELDLVWLDDLAVIKHHHSGRVSIHSTWAQDDSNLTGGIGWGAVTGALIGVLVGPGGALAGLIGGGSLAGAVGPAVDLSLDDPALDDLAASLDEGTSALVLVGETADFVDAFEDTAARLIEAELATETINELRRKVRAPAKE